jgi:hypothetical protein
LYQALAIYRSKLVERHLPFLSSKRYGDTRGVRALGRGHGRDDCCHQVPVHLVG